MTELFVLAEHRKGELRDITFEMLSKGREINQKMSATITAVLLGNNVEELAKKLAEYAHKVLIINDNKLKEFDAEAYQKVMSYLILEYKPLLTLIGHTSFGIELAPSLATELNIPLATDCIKADFEEEKLVVVRQVYGDKVNVKASLRKSENYILTLRPSTFEVQEIEPFNGEIIEIPSPLKKETSEKKFIEYYEPPISEVDITAEDILVAVGRGIKDTENLPIVEKLAEAFGAPIACSRPIVDKGWLTAERQVGTSGKTVKPKLYIAVGISGAFQHVSGMKNSDLIIAINKDPKAPIFRVADYGVVEDLEIFVPRLTSKIMEEKSK
ncbi:MAG: electron transfer flavoprotein subunit alpha/FixB family protein [Promethearchaeota archaeon]